MLPFQTVRDDNPDIQKPLWQLLQAGDVQNKDQMAVNTILRLS